MDHGTCLAGVRLRNMAGLGMGMELVEVVTMCVLLATSPALLVCSLAHPTSRRVASDMPRLSAAGVLFCKFLIGNVQPPGWLLFWRVKNRDGNTFCH